VDDHDSWRAAIRIDGPSVLPPLTTSLLSSGVLREQNPIEESHNHFGIELRARAAEYFGSGSLDSAGASVRLVGDHIVEGLRPCHDPRCQRNGCPLPTVQVTVPVKTLMVMSHDRPNALPPPENFRFCSPLIGWVRITAHSSAVRGMGL